MTEIVPFVFNNLNIRVVMIDDEPWFVLKDLTEAVDIANVSDLRKRLNPNDVNTIAFSDGKRGNPNKIIVNESGMYDTIVRSSKPEAAEFRHWVTAEVLPTIRKTGGMYVKPGSQAELDLLDPRTRLNTIREALEIAEEYEAKLALEKAAHDDTRQYVAQLEPVAESWMNLAEAEGDYAVGDVSAILNRDPHIETGQNRLFTFMAAQGWIRKVGTGRERHWRPYQATVTAGYLREKTGKEYWDDDDQTMRVGNPQVRVTIKGVHKLHKLMRGVEALAV